MVHKQNLSLLRVCLEENLETFEFRKFWNYTKKHIWRQVTNLNTGIRCHVHAKQRTWQVLLFPKFLNGLQGQH